MTVPYDRERIVQEVLAANGQENMRETAARLGIGLSTLWKVMRREGYAGRSVTRWERVHPRVSVASRDVDAV